jgi:hypothetical protein
VFALGDIVRLFAPTAGHDKYHLCVAISNDEGVSEYIFLNSDPSFAHTFVVDCDKLPFLPVSDTGKTAFSFAMVPRYSERQLRLYRAEKIGELPQDLAADLYAFAQIVPTIAGAQRRLVIRALRAIAGIGDD